ncbi:MAG: hypothetical protein WC666_00920 [Candidatus Paceibacterota bacterium]|jgi:hypothetical protein
MDYKLMTTRIVFGMMLFLSLIFSLIYGLAAIIIGHLTAGLIAFLILSDWKPFKNGWNPAKTVVLIVFLLFGFISLVFIGCIENIHLVNKIQQKISS